MMALSWAAFLSISRVRLALPVSFRRVIAKKVDIGVDRPLVRGDNQAERARQSS